MVCEKCGRETNFDSSVDAVLNGWQCPECGCYLCDDCAGWKLLSEHPADESICSECAKKFVPAIPDFGDVVCSRDGEGPHTNVPHRIVRHSPSGLLWGYGGSGPADLALNILSVYIGQRLAEGLYQDFKFEVVAKLPHEGGTIKREDILKWVEQKKPNNDERAKIERWDFVDNTIFDMLEELNPTGKKLDWDIKPISEIREVIINYFEEMKICTEDEFYP